MTCHDLGKGDGEEVPTGGEGWGSKEAGRRTPREEFEYSRNPHINLSFKSVLVVKKPLSNLPSDYSSVKIPFPGF